MRNPQEHAAHLWMVDLEECQYPHLQLEDSEECQQPYLQEDSEELRRLRVGLICLEVQCQLPRVDSVGLLADSEECNQQEDLEPLPLPHLPHPY